MEASCMREQLNNDETIMDANNPSEAEEMRARNEDHEAFLAVDFLAKSGMEAVWQSTGKAGEHIYPWCGWISHHTCIII